LQETAIERRLVSSLEDVPQKAISMSVKQILKSKHIICSVPDSRKATAVKNSLEHEVNSLYPATILQTHQNCTYFLDKSSASLLSKDTLAAITLI
jgi:glucosamine-6-phosphate deaminase